MADFLAKKGSSIIQKRIFKLSYESIKRLISSKFNTYHKEALKQRNEGKPLSVLIDHPEFAQSPRKTAVCSQIMAVWEVTYIELEYYLPLHAAYVTRKV